MLGNLSGWHLVVILFIILLLFGAPKLPALARSLGQSARILKKEVTSDDEKADTKDTSVKSEAAPAETPQAEAVAPEVDEKKSGG